MNSPARQSSQKLRSELESFPDGHVTHADKPCSFAYVPATHSWQVVGKGAREVLVNWPTGQRVQAPEKSSRNVPGPQKAVGAIVGAAVGSEVGGRVGSGEGFVVGSGVGRGVGRVDGGGVGSGVGLGVGYCVARVGDSVGRGVDGTTVGELVMRVGGIVGTGTGSGVGLGVSEVEGNIEGGIVGGAVLSRQMSFWVEVHASCVPLQLVAPQHEKGVGLGQGEQDAVPLRSAGVMQSEPEQDNDPVPAKNEFRGQRL